MIKKIFGFETDKDKKESSKKKIILIENNFEFLKIIKKKRGKISKLAKSIVKFQR